MQANDVTQLLLYGSKLWGRQFPVPTERQDLALTQQVWSDMLGDFDSRDVRAAMVAWQGDWPPNPGQLRRATQEFVRRSNGDAGVPDLDQAYAEVLEAVRRIGYTGSPEWSHPAVAQAVRAVGGWRAICESDNEPALRAHFAQMYRSASARITRESEVVAPAISRRLAEVGDGRIDPMAVLEQVSR